MKSLLLAVWTALGLLYARLFGGPMDGTAWEVKLKPDSFFSFGQRETLVFEQGQLSAAAHAEKGFKPAVYSAQSGKGDIETIWNASLAHVENGVMNFHGLVRGDRIEGVAVWWVKEGKPRRFTFAGRRKTG